MSSNCAHRRTNCKRVLQDLGDDGFALVAAIGVAIVCLLLATTVVAVAVRSATGTGAGRDRDQAYAAAEAGLDAASAVLSAGPAQWSGVCPTAPATATPAAALTTTSSYQTVVTFGSALDASGDVTGTVACGAPGAAYAQVTSTGTAATGAGAQQKRVLTAVLALAAPSSGGGGIVGNTVDLTQASYADLDGGTSGLTIRTATGDGSCGMYTEVRADVVVSAGKLVTSAYCHIHTSVKAANGVTTGAYSNIDGSVLTKPGKPVVRGTWSTTGPVSTSPNDPAWDITPLPRITETLDAWTSQGFSVRPWTGPCTVAAYTTRAVEQTTPTVYDTRTACPTGLSVGSYASLRITGADAVLLVNGFSASFYSYVASDTTSRRLWVIVPAPASGSYCPTPRDITLNSYFGTYTGVEPRLFLYSPCTVSFDSYTAMTGQVWGGTVDISPYVTVKLADLGIPSSGGSGTGGATRVSTS